MEYECDGAAARIVVGVFVGGRGSRMGGALKGLLRSPYGTDHSLLSRLLEELETLSATISVLDTVLCAGDHVAAYRNAGVTVASIADAPAGVGPIGALRALLLHANATHPDALALALAGDMPHVRASHLRSLIDGAKSGRAAVAPRTLSDGARVWEPLCALYDPRRALPVLEAQLESGRHGMQSLLTALDAHALAADDAWALALRDWDTPDDVSRDA